MIELTAVELTGKDGEHTVTITKEQYPVIMDLVLNGASGAEISRTLRYMELGEITSRQGRRMRSLMEAHLPTVVDNYVPPEDPYRMLTAVKPVTMGAVIFDLECLSPSFWNFLPGSHGLLCGSFLPNLGGDSWGEPYTLKITFDEMQRVNERRLLLDIMDELRKYQFVIGHNVKGYDINLLLTKLMYYRIPLGTTRFYYYDTFSSLKRNAIKTGKGLGNMINFMRLPIEVAEKPEVTALQWDSVRTGDEDLFEDIMEVVVDRCESDVNANLQVFSLMMDDELRYDRKPSWMLWPN